VTRPIAIVAGYVVRYPVAGMAAVYLNYLHGLRELGFEPIFVESSLVESDCYDVGRGAMTDDPSYGTAFLEATFASVGLAGTRWWFANERGDHGMSRDEAIDVLERAEVLLNVGCSTWHQELKRVGRRIVIDCDPPITQIRLAGRDPYLEGIIDSHDTLFTYAVNLADGWAPLPAAGRTWNATVTPVHAGTWSDVAATDPPADGRGWTSITSWGQSPNVRWDGVDYGNKVSTYSALLDLPAKVDSRLELAVAGDAPLADLEAHGWHVADPVDATRSWDAFRSYVASSTGELGVAKQAFVRARTGALNDRSLAYLAAGRPVVCSDTGLGWLGSTEGLLPFTDADTAAAAIREVEADPARHGAAARRLAMRFDAATVLGELLAAAAVPVPRR
jgi:hypothetical protein